MSLVCIQAVRQSTRIQGTNLTVLIMQGNDYTLTRIKSPVVCKVSARSQLKTHLVTFPTQSIGIHSLAAENIVTSAVLDGAGHAVETDRDRQRTSRSQIA